MDADIHTLYQSDFYRIMDFKCRCVDCRTSKPEYNEAFCISFVRKGNFLFNVFRRSLDSYTGCVLITKPGYERTVTHAHSVPFHRRLPPKIPMPACKVPHTAACYSLINVRATDQIQQDSLSQPQTRSIAL